MNPSVQLLLWLALSFAIGLLGSIAIRSGQINATLTAGVASEVALFAYVIGLPFLALIAGSLSLDLIGLGSDWFSEGHIAGFAPASWLRGLGITASAVAFVLIVLWLVTRSSVRHDAWPAANASTLLLLRDAAYDEVHWAFYRSPFVLLFGDAYWGTVAGFGVIVLERWLQARLSGNVLHDNRDQLIVLLCLLTSSFLYVVTRNLWLMIAADAVIRVIGARLMYGASTSVARDA